MPVVFFLPWIGALLQSLNDHSREEAKQFLPVQQGSRWSHISFYVVHSKHMHICVKVLSWASCCLKLKVTGCVWREKISVLKQKRNRKTEKNLQFFTLLPANGLIFLFVRFATHTFVSFILDTSFVQNIYEELKWKLGSS